MQQVHSTSTGTQWSAFRAEIEPFTLFRRLQISEGMVPLRLFLSVVENIEETWNSSIRRTNSLGEQWDYVRRTTSTLITWINLPRKSAIKSVNCPSSVGIEVPVSWLSPVFAWIMGGGTSNSERIQILSAIVEQRECFTNLIYLPKSSSSKLVNCPSSVGIVPVRLLTAVFGNIGDITNNVRTQHHQKDCGTSEKMYKW